MTVYLYTVHHERHMKVKHIYCFASEYLKSWFLKFGSYQAFNNRRLNKLGGAFPGQTLCTPALVNDVTVFKEAWPGIENRTFWNDKIYFVNDLNEHMLKHQNTEMLTPVKAAAEVIKQKIKAANDLFSTAVSRVMEPVEAIFNQ